VSSAHSLIDHRVEPLCGARTNQATPDACSAAAVGVFQVDHYARLTGSEKQALSAAVQSSGLDRGPIPGYWMTDLLAAVARCRVHARRGDPAPAGPYDR
jgi:hypothetical protein